MRVGGMLFTIDEIMTPRESCDCSGFALDGLYMKLNRLKIVIC